MMRQLTPDLVTLDLVMPGRDGLTTLRHLQLIDSSVPVVVCSASLAESKVIAALHAGAKGFTAKPLEPGKVLDAVREVLGSSESPPDRAPSVPLEASVSAAPTDRTPWFSRARFGSVRSIGRSEPVIRWSRDHGRTQPTGAAAALPRGDRAFVHSQSA
jgi:DNA-binding response OmpR family regulator